MHLLTVCYFLTYHTLATVILRRTHFFAASRGMLDRLLQVFAMAYVVAVLEAVSISAFPHYVRGAASFASTFSILFFLSCAAYRHPDDFFFFQLMRTHLPRSDTRTCGPCCCTGRPFTPSCFS